MTTPTSDFDEILHQVRREARDIVRSGMLGPNAVPAKRWTDDLPYAVQTALEVAEDHGVACDLYDDPVFYEAEVDLLRCGTNMGTVVGTVVGTVSAHLRAHDVPADTIIVITDAIRTSGYRSGSFDEGLHALLRWVNVASNDDDD